jgi:hypothetical protein
MNLLSNCSEKKIYPWLHYIIYNYFELNLLEQLVEKINYLDFIKSNDDFRDEYTLNPNLNDKLFNSIIDSFLHEDNIKFISDIDNRIKNNSKLLRVSIWKDYKGFNLPIHTDSHFKLFTMQVYLPRNNETNYGTTIYDQNGTIIKKTDYKLNNGYFFFPNINNIKTNHSFIEDIKTERCSIIFNVFDKEYYSKKNKNITNLKFLPCIEF